jgi:prepilin-type N-terminal cleavage/methylation domain-containing protein
MAFTGSMGVSPVSGVAGCHAPKGHVQQLKSDSPHMKLLPNDDAGLFLKDMPLRGMAPVMPRTRPRRPRHPGFTFIEILATLTLLAVVLPAIMSGLSLSLSAGGLARQQAEAARLAQGKLAELSTAGQLQHAELSGDFGLDWPEYRWKANVSDWEGSTLQQLDLTVAWRHRGKDRDVTLSTLVYSGTTQ